MKKILIVFGTRPEAIKMAPLVKAFKKDDESFETRVCVTAQHREMLDQVLNFFDLVPEYDLNIMQTEQDLYDVTSRILLGLRAILLEFKPDIVFVHGDTSTTFATALAAFYQKIQIAHIEAGLRTGDILSPWPEEANRKLTTQLTTYHFTPTNISEQNLLRENVKEENIIVVGNTVIDALFLALEKIKSHEAIEKNILAQFSRMSYHFKLERKIILVTGHRRENHGQGFIDICLALKTIAVNNPEVDIVYPVHLNPNVQEPVNKLLRDIENIYLISPLEYEQFIYLMAKSYFILTDSGGIQEEGPSLGKPVLLMRNTTERPEVVEAGTVKLVGTNKDKIILETQKLLEDEQYYLSMLQEVSPYGDGNSSTKVVKHIKQKLKEL